MYLTLFALIGYQLGMGKLYWIMLSFSAFMKLLEITLSWLERREGK